MSSREEGLGGMLQRLLFAAVCHCTLARAGVLLSGILNKHWNSSVFGKAVKEVSF